MDKKGAPHPLGGGNKDGSDKNQGKKGSGGGARENLPRVKGKGVGVLIEGLDGDCLEGGKGKRVGVLEEVLAGDILAGFSSWEATPGVRSGGDQDAGTEGLNYRWGVEIQVEGRMAAEGGVIKGWKEALMASQEGRLKSVTMHGTVHVECGGV